MGPLDRAWRGGRSDWRLHLLSVFSVAVAFVCLASALLVVVNVDGVRSRWASSGRASVFLRTDVSEQQVRTVERALRGSPGVVEVQYVSSAEARRALLTARSDEVIESLPEAAFPASLEVKLVDDAAAQRLEKMSGQLTALPMVESVETYGQWNVQLASLLKGGMTAAALLAFVVLAAVVSVVSSTIRLTLQRRRIEVEVLKLVGATDSFVRRPFVIEGAAQGSLGAALAIGLLAVLYGIVRGHFDSELGLLLGMNPTFLPWFLQLGMVLLGAALGAGAAFASLRKLLTV